MTELCEFADSCRQATPIPDERALSVAEQAQDQLLGGVLMHWLKNDLPGFLFERSDCVAEIRGIDKEPGLVVTTSPVGLIAATNIIGHRQPLSCYLLEQEYREYCDEHPDPNWQWHLHHWSWIETDANLGEDSCREEFPLSEGESYWIHHTGVSVAFLFERSFKHLWKWSAGSGRPELLKPYMEQVIS